MKDYIDFSAGRIKVGTDVIQKMYEDLIIYYRAVTTDETGDDEEREYDVIDEIVINAMLQEDSYMRDKGGYNKDVRF